MTQMGEHAGKVSVELGDFGNKTILWGAGLSKNWGGFLADEFWGHLLGRPEPDQFPRLREVLLSESSFERVLDRVARGDFTDEERRSLWLSVQEVFAVQDSRLLETVRGSSAPPVNEARFLKFLDAFKPDRSRATSGYLFTLNQDVLFEAMGSRDPLQTIPACPAVFPSERAFSLDFRSPLLLDTDKEIRTVPGSEPVRGWPALRGGLHYVKLHGSSTWRTAAGNTELVIGGDKTALIDRSPLLSWYRDIFRAVCHYGCVRMLIIGYGFRDEHINDILAEGVASRHLNLYVVGNESNSSFREHLDPRLLSGLRGYTTTPLSEIVGAGTTDTVAMRSIEEFLRYCPSCK